MADIIYDEAKATEMMMTVNKADLVLKKAAGAAEGLAISVVVHKVVKKIIPEDAPWWEKLAIWGASLAVGGVVSSLNEKRLMEEHNEFTDGLTQIKSMLDKTLMPEPEVEVIVNEQS